jgi:hypothetical protein
MTAPPPVLSARTRVTHYAILGPDVGFNGAGRIFVGGRLLGRVPRLALSRQDEGGTLLMHCGSTWNVRTAFSYPSVLEAKKAAERRYPGSSARWVRVDTSKAKAEAYLNRVYRGRTCSFCRRRPDQVSQMFHSRRDGAKVCEVCVGKMTAFLGAERAQRARHDAAHGLLLTSGEPAAVYLESPVLVLIDPVVLHRHRGQLRELAGAPERVRLRRLAAIGGSLRIGVRRIPRFMRGFHVVGPEDVVPARGRERDIADVRSGAVIVTDLAALPALAAVLTQERYDRLRADRAAEAERLSRDLGYARLLVLQAAQDGPFAGDGAYRLRPGAPEKT